jgi:hypothetical protein
LSLLLPLLSLLPFAVVFAVASGVGLGFSPGISNRQNQGL